MFLNLIENLFPPNFDITINGVSGLVAEILKTCKIMDMIIQYFTLSNSGFFKLVPFNWKLNSTQFSYQN